MKITIPTSRNWQVSYFGDVFSNVVDTFNADFHYSEGKVRTSSLLYPHTATSDIAGIHIATAFVMTNADNTSGTLKYWAACEKLYKQQNIFSSIFAADGDTNSPTSLTDSDLVKWGITLGDTVDTTKNGIDILVCSTPTSLSLLNYFAAGNAFAWINHWWDTDLADTFSSTGTAAPISVVVASSGNYHTNDIIEITGSGTQYASYTGNGTTTSTYVTVTGLYLTETQTMGIGSAITGTNIPSNTTIVSVTQATTSSSTDGVATISNPATGTGSVSLTWSDMIGRTIDGLWTITVVDGTHISLNGSSGLNSFGNATNISYVGTIARIFNHTTGYYFLGQTPLVSGVAHALVVFGSSPELFITDGYQVHSIGTPGSFGAPTAPSDVSYGRLVFKPGYTCTWGCATSLKIYFGLQDNRGTSYPSLVEEYDPFNEQVHEIVVQNGATIGFINGNNLNIIDIKGMLKSYNGNDFDVYAEFPTTSMDATAIGLPHRNGITVCEDRINFLINPNAYYPDGWWTYELDSKRLYHQGSPVTSKTAQTSFGSQMGDTFGAFFSLGLNEFFAGVSTYLTNGGSIQQGIFVFPGFLNTLGYNPIGRITLGKIPSGDIDSVWRNILVKYSSVLDRLGLQTGNIVVKYKTADYPYNGYNLSGTWVTATYFVADQPSKIVNGAEIVITTGQASGASVHVTNISGSYITVTDESLGFVPSGQFQFNIDNFLRMPTTNAAEISDITDNTRNTALRDVPETTTGEWIQFKLEIRGGFSVDEVQLGVEPNRAVEPDQSRPDGNAIVDR